MFYVINALAFLNVTTLSSAMYLFLKYSFYCLLTFALYFVSNLSCVCYLSIYLNNNHFYCYWDSNAVFLCFLKRHHRNPASLQILTLNGLWLFSSRLTGDVCRCVCPVDGNGLCAHLCPTAEMSSSSAPEEARIFSQQAHFPSWRYKIKLCPHRYLNIIFFVPLFGLIISLSHHSTNLSVQCWNIRREHCATHSKFIFLCCRSRWKPGKHHGSFQAVSRNHHHNDTAVYLFFACMC